MVVRSQSVSRLPDFETRQHGWSAKASAGLRHLYSNCNKNGVRTIYMRSCYNICNYNNHLLVVSSNIGEVHSRASSLPYILGMRMVGYLVVNKNVLMQSCVQTGPSTARS